MSPLLVGTVTALSIRLLIPWVGQWIADVDLDLASDKPLPSGRVVITVGGAQLIGTVDPDGSGRLGEKAHVRVIAGAGAWHKHVPRLEFHNDAGLQSTDVLTATAGLVGESVVEAKPTSFGVRYARASGPASSVLDGLSWYVDAQGVTQVRERTPITPSTDVEILDWFADEKRAELAADTIVWPGMVLTDSRIGTQTVREVEQVFSSESGARVNAWMTIGSKPSTDATRYHAVMRRMVERYSGVKHSRTYRYRIVFQGVDGRLTLQAVDADAGTPDTLPVDYFGGMAGDRSKFTLGTECLVHFTEGNPQRMLVAGFGDTVPIERHIHALTLLELGNDLAMPLAHAAETITSLVALSTNVGSVNSLMATLLASISAQISALTTYAQAIQPVADPLNTATPALVSADAAAVAAITAYITALATAASTAIAAVTGAVPTLPTVIVKGT